MDNQFWEFCGAIFVALIAGVSSVAVAFIGRPQRADQPGSPPATQPGSRNRLLFLWSVLAVVSLLSFALLIFLTWAPKDRLVQWKKEIEKHLDACTQNHSSCLGEAIKKSPPPSQGPKASADFYEDMRMGALFMEIPRAQETLRVLLGIDADSFIGSGYSIPWESTYAQTRAREYLIPNLSETHVDVWAWQLKPAYKNYHRLVQEILASPPINKLDQKGPKVPLDTVMEQMKRVGALPPVIRIQQFSHAAHSGRLGRREAVRVFAVNLRDVWDMTLEQAAASTGYPLSPDDAADAKLFIWLFVPEHADEVLRATWGNIIERLPEWIKNRKTDK